MANPNAPFGLRPVIRAGGSAFSVTTYGKPSSDSQAIFMFDAVAKVSGGAVPLNESPQYNVPAIASGYRASYGPGTGVWAGVSLNYGAASAATNHNVFDELDCIFLVQCKSGTTNNTTALAAGKTALLSITTPGSTLTKLSGMTVDSSTIPGTSSADVWIRSVAMLSPYTEGDSAVFEVSFNRHIYALQPTLGV